MQTEETFILFSFVLGFCVMVLAIKIRSCQTPKELLRMKRMVTRVKCEKGRF